MIRSLSGDLIEPGRRSSDSRTGQTGVAVCSISSSRGWLYSKLRLGKGENERRDALDNCTAGKETERAVWTRKELMRSMTLMNEARAARVRERGLVLLLGLSAAAP